MQLRRRLVITIGSVTAISLLAFAVLLQRELFQLSQDGLKSQITDLRRVWILGLDNAVNTSKAVYNLIEADEITRRYYKSEKSREDINLYRTYSFYISEILSNYPKIGEISIIYPDGTEDIRVSYGIRNKSYEVSNVNITKAAQKPSEYFYGIEYHEDYEKFVLVFYKAFQLQSRVQRYGITKSRVVSVLRVVTPLNNIFQTEAGSVDTSIKPLLVDRNGNILPYGVEVPKKNEILLSYLSSTHYPYLDKSISLYIDQHELPGDVSLITALDTSDWEAGVAGTVNKMATLVILLFLSLAAVLSYTFTRLVIKPLESLVKASHDVNIVLPKKDLDREDEIGVLLKSFNKMRNRLTEQNKELKEQAFTDTLTGLPNRNALPELLSRCALRMRSENKIMALLFLDLDGFKQVNDVYGHAVGDELLKKVAVRISSVLRPDDIVHRIGSEISRPGSSLIRLGGDEFTVILPDIGKFSNSKIVGDRIISSMKEPFKLKGSDIYVGCSIGIALLPDDATTVENLIKYADTAMYAAKRQGKMRAVHYEESMTAADLAQLETENAISYAINNGEVETWLQPKVDPIKNQICGFEALARINSKKYGFITPDRFIPIAEKQGAIDAITMICVENCCRAHIEIDRAYSRKLSMALNLSPRQLASNELFEKIFSKVEEYGLHPSVFEFEVTESSLMIDEVDSKKRLIFLQNRGFKTALDDFGVGYSSLGHLKQYSFDTLKIDRLFFRDIEKDETAEAILLSILDLAKRLKMVVVAEGIETADQLQFVIDHQLDLVQGYIFSKPIPGNDIIEFMRLFHRAEHIAIKTN